MKINKEKLIELLEKNYVLSEIAKITGWSISSIQQYCRRNNILYNKLRRGGQNTKDMSNTKTSKITILKRAGSKKKLATWLCLCACGKEFVAIGADIRNGKISTCGCRINIDSKRNWQGYGHIPRGYWSSIYNNAKQRNIKIDVTIEYINKLYVEQKGFCKLSGLPIFFHDKTASLDRIDSKLGYIAGNLQWVHKDINKIKSTFDNSYFIKLCQEVAKNVNT